MKALCVPACLLLLFAACGPAALIAQSSSTNTSAPITEITYHGKAVTLNQRALYLNGKLKADQSGPYTFRSLQELAAKATSGTAAEPTVVYVAPNVYWTDDPNSSNAENSLIGLRLPQANISMIALSDNPDHTIIAGNRGQQAGARGNWNTIGLGDGFRAYNITFGNYCNVDLVYALDPSKNFPKRQKTITQAQTITRASNDRMDRMLFDNCKFISYLNLLALGGGGVNRVYYKNCFFQCTDDAIAGGSITVFENCSFKYYSNHPSGGGSPVIQAYLGCKFDAVLRDAGSNSTIFFAKANAAFPTIDGVFTGNAQRLEWTDLPSDVTRQYVYNNTLHGKPVLISATRPELSVNLNAETLKPFKVGNEYNIYNLLREDDDWDPAGQKTRLANYANLAFRLVLRAASTRLKSNEQATISYTIYPARVRATTPLKWSVSDPAALALVVNTDGTVTVTGHNATDKTFKVYVKAETAAGIVGIAAIDVLANALPAPAITKALQVGEPGNGTIRANYGLDLGTRTDQSLVTWYRATSADGADSIPVAVSRLNEPLKSYTLTTGDIGYYLVARLSPKHESSIAGTPVAAFSRKITANDVASKNIHTTFKNCAVQRSTSIRDGWWTLDTYRPADVGKEFEWLAGTGNALAYGMGSDGTAGRFGLMTVSRGARLLYAPLPGTYGDMAVTASLSPHKGSGQGFGSATGQFADVYIKFDPKTLTGYGLRIERTPAHGEGVKFMLYRFVNGVGTPISKEVFSSAFMPGCTVKLKVTGTTLTANVSTTTAQHQIQKDNGLAPYANLTATIEKNPFGGTGLQHTGTVSGGNRLMVEGFDINYL